MRFGADGAKLPAKRSELAGFRDRWPWTAAIDGSVRALM